MRGRPVRSAVWVGDHGEPGILPTERRWDEAADPPLDVVAYAAPPREHALKGAPGEGQPWTMLASTGTRRKPDLPPQRGGPVDRTPGADRASPIRRGSGGSGPGPDPRGGLDGERMGGPVPRGVGPRGGGRGSELRADVRDAQSEGEDRSDESSKGGSAPFEEPPGKGCAGKAGARSGPHTRGGWALRGARLVGAARHRLLRLGAPGEDRGSARCFLSITCRARGR